MDWQLLSFYMLSWAGFLYLGFLLGQFAQMLRKYTPPKRVWILPEDEPEWRGLLQKKR